MVSRNPDWQQITAEGETKPLLWMKGAVFINVNRRDNWLKDVPGNGYGYKTLPRALPSIAPSSSSIISTIFLMSS